MSRGTDVMGTIRVLIRGWGMAHDVFATFYYCLLILKLVERFTTQSYEYYIWGKNRLLGKPFPSQRSSGRMKTSKGERTSS